MDTKAPFAHASLQRLALLSCTGDDARAFLHAQLTSDVAALTDTRARRAGWCSAKGRLLAILLVIPHEGGFLLSLSSDLAPAVAKRLSMFVLRAKVKIADVTAAWTRVGLWGPGAGERLAALGLAGPKEDLDVARSDMGLVVGFAHGRRLVLVPAAQRGVLFDTPAADETAWELEEIRAGEPQVVLATQDQFVPQMLNLERLAAVDFKKGCYPGQEIVARTQYRGVLKRRMVRAQATAQAAPGDDVYADDLAGQASGTVVRCAALPAGGSEMLVVAQISALEGGGVLRVRGADGPALTLLPLPYA